MPSVNIVHLIGNLGKDPALNYTQGGQAVCKFSIATTKTWFNKQNEKQTKTTWHNIVLWGKTAESAGKYLKKGSSVYVQGEIDNRSWDDKETGQKKYITEIVGHMVQFLSMQKKDEMDQRPAADDWDQTPREIEPRVKAGSADDPDMPF